MKVHSSTVAGLDCKVVESTRAKQDTMRVSLHTVLHSAPPV